MFSMLAIIATLVLLASALLWRAVLKLPRASTRLAAILRGSRPKARIRSSHG